MYRVSVLYAFVCLVLFFVCCTEERNISPEILQLAGDNAGQLQAVVRHYRGEPEKERAALFLINNMAHGYNVSKASDLFRERVFASEARKVAEYNHLWFAVDSLGPKGGSRLLDARTLTSEFLIEHIDRAFDAWKFAPWADQISFKTFCRYILPYRVLDEPPSAWHEPLRKKYAFLVEGETSPDRAFAKVYLHLLKEFDTMSLKFPHTPDVLFSDRLMTGVCAQRCTYIICVMRSLGIPATYDMVHYWANYSTSGHSWVAYVPVEGQTLTMLPTDTLPLSGNVIDASVFHSEIGTELARRFHVDSVKRVSKVFRRSYELVRPMSPTAPSHEERETALFRSPFVLDVSDQYVQTCHRVELFIDKDLKPAKGGEVWLCTFASIYDWQPAAVGRIRRGRAFFDHVGSGVVYLPVVMESDGTRHPLSDPFLLSSDGSKLFFRPLNDNARLVLRRKYVLYAHWIQRWGKMIGTRFEGSNYADFRKTELLHEVTVLPEGIVRVELSPSRPYRYIRMQAREDARPNLAELAYYDVDGREIKGRILMCEGFDLQQVEKATDNDYSTYGGGMLDHYWWGYDLGPNPPRLASLSYCMRHDMNMIVEGNRYELFYYEDGWQSLGQQTATCDSLVYEAPAGALYWLRNLTEGREERIFSYEEGRQVWW